VNLPVNLKRGSEKEGPSNMTSDPSRGWIYGRERWEKKLGDGESGAGVDALGGESLKIQYGRGWQEF